MTRAGVLRPDGTPKKATIRVKGGVSVRNGSEEGYDYRVRTLDFANSDVPFTAEESRELAAALANDDNARVVALLERHATLDYPENKGFDRYSNDFGFHFDSIESVPSTGITPPALVVRLNGTGESGDFQVPRVSWSRHIDFRLRVDV